MAAEFQGLPYCRETARVAPDGSCPVHGGDWCLATPLGLVEELRRAELAAEIRRSALEGLLFFLDRGDGDHLPEQGMWQRAFEAAHAAVREPLGARAFYAVREVVSAARRLSELIKELEAAAESTLTPGCYVVAPRLLGMIEGTRGLLLRALEAVSWAGDPVQGGQRDG